MSQTLSGAGERAAERNHIPPRVHVKGSGLALRASQLDGGWFEDLTKYVMV